MVKIRAILIVMTLGLSFGNSFAQDYVKTKEDKTDKNTPKPHSSFWDRIYVGGNMGAEFGSVTYVELSPLFGYRITDKLSAGFGVTYIYWKDNLYNVSTSIYGGRVFGRYNIFDFLFVHAEYEMLNLDCFHVENQGGIAVINQERAWVPGLLLGGGLRQPFGNSGSGAYVMGLYNVLDSDCSPYASPFILRVGIAFGL